MAKAKHKKEQDNHETLDALPEDIALQAAAEDMTEIEEETLEADLSEEALLDEDMADVAEDVSAEAEESTEPTEMPAITQDDLRLVEAILFAAPHALTVQQIAERFPEDRIMLIPDVLEMLKEHYAVRGVMLVQREKRWALRTATDLGHHLRLEKEQPKKFTRAAMETMAIIAYHQPVTRAEIENIRGVATSPGALDALMEAGWIKPGKRREVPGRPVTWLTTQAFLDHFGLEKLEDLPGMEELKAAGLLDKRPAIEAMPTADLFGDGETKEDIDPNEVTDEDLLGKPDANDEVLDTENETVASDGDEDDEDFDDEDDGEDSEDSDDDEDEEDSEDDDSDASDEDDDTDEDDGDDESDDDEDDDDFDDEDGEGDDAEDEESEDEDEERR